eukprot:6213697-Pleurochrysis_carterae.AAC.2
MDVARRARVVKGRCALWVTLAMLAGTRPYHRPTALTRRLGRGCAGDPTAPQDRLPLNHSPEDSIADALLRRERANTRLRSALTVPPSDPDHAYLRSWVDRVGACDLAEIICDDTLFDTPVPECSSPELVFHPFTPSIEPPRTEPVPPPRLQPVTCYAQTSDSPHELLTPCCFHTP